MSNFDLKRAIDNLKEEQEVNISLEELKNKVSSVIPENTSYKDLAKVVGLILKEDYGEHNFRPFLDTLEEELGYIYL